ncbi:flavin monoamine oxidase family protein [Chitinimonas sp.]|uniref:flavin monoamine oxidase family protein n=1 Tax=Chitinimonas sp. TaxID=1934313 RepID=UPI0035B0563E
MQRRDFLKLASLCLAAAAARAQTRPPVAAKRNRVLVLGAGMAGLAAARTLTDRGYGVIVLEARQRTGGRIDTSNHWPDLPLDLGASWIHGIDQNPLTELAAKAGARTHATYYSSATDYFSDGSRISQATDRDIESWTDAIFSALSRAQDADHDDTLRRVVEREVRWSKLGDYDKSLINYVINGVFEQEYAGAAERLSAWYGDSGKEFGGDDVLFPDGYLVLTDYLARGLDIRLGQVVERVANDRSGVTVVTGQGSFRADHVVLTLPLGVLQGGAITFSPALPPAKRAAINKLGVGVLNKCYLRFPQVFWPDTDWISYLPELARRGQWEEWINIHRFSGQPVLLGFNAAQFGNEIESWRDADIVASAMATLRTLFGSSIPAPSDWQITRWASDPFARGSYSFNQVGATPAMRDTLAASVGGRLHFAGEACHRDHFGTVHGAYLSGLRAASMIRG